MNFLDHLVWPLELGQGLYRIRGPLLRSPPDLRPDFFRSFPPDQRFLFRHLKMGEETMLGDMKGFSKLQSGNFLFPDFGIIVKKGPDFLYSYLHLPYNDRIDWWPAALSLEPGILCGSDVRGLDCEYHGVHQILGRLDQGGRRV